MYLDSIQWATELSESELKLMTIIERLVSSKHNATPERITYLIERKVIIERWPDVADQLIRKGLLSLEHTEHGEIHYEPTGMSAPICEKIRKESLLTRCFYRDFYRRAEESKAHSTFCCQAYGIDLCQHGVVDLRQLDELVEHLTRQQAHRILDLGCGNGLITQYIAEKTSAHVVGIDFADDAIARAQKRVEKYQPQIQFAVQNISHLDYPENSFDAILSADSLYFVDPLEPVLRNLHHILQPGGKMYLFFLIPPQNGEPVPPASCRLGRSLTQLGYHYDLVDYTAVNRTHWERKEQVLLALRESFANEGNLFLYNNRMEECQGRNSTFNRYLFIVDSRK